MSDRAGHFCGALVSRSRLLRCKGERENGMWRGLNWAGVHPVYRGPRHSDIRVKSDEGDMGKSGSHELFYLKPPPATL